MLVGVGTSVGLVVDVGPLVTPGVGSVVTITGVVGSIGTVVASLVCIGIDVAVITIGVGLTSRDPDGMRVTVWIVGGG